MRNRAKMIMIGLCTVAIIAVYKSSITNFRQKKWNKENSLTYIEKNLDSKVDEAGGIYKGNFVVRKDNKYGIMNESSGIIKSIEYDRILRLNQNVYYLQKDKKGEILNLDKNISYEIEELNSINDNYYKIMYQGKYGVVDKNLKEILPMKYDYIDYNNKYILAFIGHNKELYTNEGKRHKLELEKENLRLGVGDSLYIRVKNKWKVVNEKGEKILKEEYDNFLNLNEKNLLIGYIGEEKYFINLDKKIEKRVAYESFGGESDGIIMILKDGKIGYINDDGNEIIAPKYDGGFVVKEGKNLFQVKKGDKWLLLDKEGNEYRELDYTDMGEYSDGYILVEKNGKFGYIDENGEEVIKLDYSYANSFKDGIAIVANENGFGVINKENKKIVPLIYDDLDIVNNYIYVIQDNRAGLLNKNGDEVLPLLYDSIGRVEDGVVFVKQGAKVGYINIGR